MPHRTEEEIVEHLLSQTVIDDITGCFLWQGAKAGKGYGVTCWQGKQVYIHRLAYTFEFPNEKLNVVRHTCDRPNCWRVDHLRNGTTQDNIDDKIAKCRHIFGSDNYNAKFTDVQIRDIRQSTLSIYKLAALYKVSPSNIHYIKVRKTWKHVT